MLLQRAPQSILVEPAGTMRYHQPEFDAADVVES